jgi:hypothetical protein
MRGRNGCCDQLHVRYHRAWTLQPRSRGVQEQAGSGCPHAQARKSAKQSESVGPPPHNTADDGLTHGQAIPTHLPTHKRPHGACAVITHPTSNVVGEKKPARPVERDTEYSCIRSASGKGMSGPSLRRHSGSASISDSAFTYTFSGRTNVSAMYRKTPRPATATNCGGGQGRCVYVCACV